MLTEGQHEETVRFLIPTLGEYSVWRVRAVFEGARMYRDACSLILTLSVLALATSCNKRQDAVKQRELHNGTKMLMLFENVQAVHRMAGASIMDSMCDSRAACFVVGCVFRVGVVGRVDVRSLVG